MIRTTLSVLAAVISTVLFACAGGQTSKLHAASGTPAAIGEVKTAEGDNGNTKVTVEVEHLAPPQNVERGASVYVVWAKPHSQDAPQNLGALRIDEERKGKLETKTPLKRFDVLVTPETSPTVSLPAGEPVMTATVAGK